MIRGNEQNKLLRPTKSCQEKLLILSVYLIYNYKCAVFQH
uniref:Uncharacterized protein n=1 Tax=Octopus bimaculoides TaxID=37653 RepID=A0A0L8GJW8_OCTBM